MSTQFDGVNDSVDGVLTTPIVSGSGFTMFCWFKQVNHPIVNGAIFHFGQNRATNEDSIILRTAAVDDQYDCRADAAALSTISVVKTGIDSVWTPAMLVHRSNELRRFWLADQYADNSVVTVALGSLDEIALGENLSSGQDWAGFVAEPAIWNIELDAADWALLSTGTTPAAVQAANLRFHASMATDPGVGPIPNTGLDAGGDLTIGNDAAWSSDHPVITVPGSGPVSMLSGRLGGLLEGRV